MQLEFERSSRRLGRHFYVWALLAAVLAAAGCSKRREEPEPTEPWLRGQGPGAPLSPQEAAPATVRYGATAGQSLAFELALGGSRVQGRVPVRRGFVLVDPRALEKVRGELEFDLSELSLGEEGSETTPALTEEAGRWLGLGALVPRATRDALGTARLVVDHARGLSASTFGGSALGRDAELLGTVEGELTIRRLSVHQSLRVKVRPESPSEVFDARPGRSIAPRTLVVELALPAQVSLREHDVVARDERGERVIEPPSPERKKVPAAVAVTGRVRFEIEGAAPARP